MTKPVQEIVCILVGALTLGFILFKRAVRPASLKKKLEKAEKFAKKTDWARAKGLFVEAKAYSRAAAMAMKLNEVDEAIALAKEGKDYVTAAKLLVERKEYEEAAKLLDLSNRPAEAADQYARAGLLDKALEKYRRAGHRRRAQDMLEQMGRFAELGQDLADELAGLRTLQGNFPNPQQVEAAKKLATRTGIAFEKAGDFQSAYDIFLRTTMPFEAARCLEKLNQPKRAADLYREAGKVEDAARVLLNSGEYEAAIDFYDEMDRRHEIPGILKMAGKHKEAHAVEARIKLTEGDRMKAAELFEEAEEFYEAAELYNEEGRFEKSALLWEKAGAYEKAAQAYDLLGEIEKSASLYASSGEHLKSAQTYEKATVHSKAELEYVGAEKFYNAGRMAELQNAADRAISYYQKVKLDDPEYPFSCYLLGRLFASKGTTKMADKYFQQAVSKIKMDREHLSVFYDYAVFLEELGRVSAAGQFYEKILGLDFHFKDTYARKKKIDEANKDNEAVQTEVSRVSSASSTSMTISGAGGLSGPKVGKKFGGRYQIISVLGSGGMGVIYLGEDKKLGRKVALKFLAPTFKLDREKQEEFVSEAKLTAKLSHPNIVAFYDVGNEKGQMFLVMEYVEGKDLKKWIGEKGPLSIEQGIQVAKQLVGALSYAHERNVVHRDIKSANILMNEEYVVKITDFGLARVLNNAHLTMTQSIGSPYYMAPEQIQGGRYDHRVDLYSLGIVLYEMLIGEPPFVEGEIAYHHLHTNPARPSEKRKEIPPAFDDIILKLLEKKPADRYASAQEVATILEPM